MQHASYIDFPMKETLLNEMSRSQKKSLVVKKIKNNAPTKKNARGFCLSIFIDHPLSYISLFKD